MRPLVDGGLLDTEQLGDFIWFQESVHGLQYPRESLSG